MASAAGSLAFAGVSLGSRLKVHMSLQKRLLLERVCREGNIIGVVTQTSFGGEKVTRVVRKAIIVKHNSDAISRLRLTVLGVTCPL